MIPKVIHYCWFGGNDIPENLQRCMDSWKQFMPDYQIQRWDESNYDIGKCDYIREAYAEKKWAFVSDYVRLDVCYTYGGIYLDTDVEVLKSFDELLSLDGFCGMEIGKNSKPNEVNVGLGMGMCQGQEMGRILRDEYHTMHFKKRDGSLDLTPCPTIQTHTLKKYGLKFVNEVQNINGLTVFPTDYFCPMNQYTGNIQLTPNTFSIHHYFASWVRPADQMRRRLRQEYSKFGKVIAEVLSTFIAYRKYYGMFGMWKEIIKKLRE